MRVCRLFRYLTLCTLAAHPPLTHPHPTPQNLPFKITAEELYDIFGRFGAIRQVRVGTDAATKGTAFVVYEELADAQVACDKLNGFQAAKRFLTVVYYKPLRTNKPNIDAATANVEALRARVAAGAAVASAAEEGSIDDSDDRRLMQR